MYHQKDKSKTRMNQLKQINIRYTGCDSKNKGKFHSRFDEFDLARFCNVGCGPKIANKYSPKFNGYEIKLFYSLGCLPEIANGYSTHFNGTEARILYSIGVIPSDLTNKFNNLFKTIFKDIISTLNFYPYRNDSELIGFGGTAVVIQVGSNAWKFSKNITPEYELLKKVNDYHNNKQKNVVKVLNVPHENVAIKLEKINGRSLEDVCKQLGLMSEEKSLQYGADIYNGLQELRQAGINHHRDIRPANIMIDEDNNRAVIIDLGLSSTDTEYQKTVGNRRYRGRDDLDSLGQVMYRMKIGSNPWGDSSFVETNQIADEIEKNRKETYANEAKLNRFLKNVKIDIPGKLGEIISCMIDPRILTEDKYKQLDCLFNL